MVLDHGFAVVVPVGVFAAGGCAVDVDEGFDDVVVGVGGYGERSAVPSATTYERPPGPLT